MNQPAVGKFARHFNPAADIDTRTPRRKTFISSDYSVLNEKKPHRKSAKTQRAPAKKNRSLRFLCVFVVKIFK